MKQLFDDVSAACSKLTTTTYSTSFSLGIYCLRKKFREPIYNIYGFVRFADEIVDSFHDFNKEELLNDFITDTQKAITCKISLNPILNSFQKVAHQYGIDQELIDCFLNSMKMDLKQNFHTRSSYQEYILGSAEVVGLMCLRVFTEGDNKLFEELKPAAMALGAAFQKVNFLRDIKDDYITLGRAYFPNIDMTQFTQVQKKQIETEIELDFDKALQGIKRLPAENRFGVYVAFVYYRSLFRKIKSLPSERILIQRIRIPNYKKISLLFTTYFKHSLRIL